MARIKDTSIEQVKARADFIEVVSAYTQLRKAGAHYKARCPFHEERTPSFSVNPVEKYYNCFGCGEKGDMISFVEKKQNLDFVGAIEWLADRFGIELEYEESSPAQEVARNRRKRQLDLLDAAAAFYERILWDTEAGSFARDYLAGRGLREEVCREFRLGLALGGDMLVRKALERGFTRDELRAGGLMRQNGSEYFQRRLLFPLTDARGRVRGFQARKLHEDDPLPAKYVNSPESDLFHKAEVVYGLDKARQSIAKEDRAVVVEGNTDVIALRQAGFEPVVASMGTALTEAQLRELAHLTHRVWLCFDGDAAGQAATLRGMELAAAKGFEVKVVALPPGSDPADEPAGFEERLGTAEPYLSYRVRLEIERAPDQQEGFRRVKELLGRFEDSPDRHDAVKLAADRLDLPAETAAGLVARPRRLAGCRLDEAARPRPATGAQHARGRVRLRVACASTSAICRSRTSTIPCTARSATISCTGRRWTTTATGSWPSSTPVCRPRESTRRPARSSSSGSPSARFAASCRRRRTSG